ncbi:hypothetical protein EON65_36715 [archaeon]|nr:MAG: hypothetical protein EON65_36715 [archaeon]
MQPPRRLAKVKMNDVAGGLVVYLSHSDFEHMNLLGQNFFRQARAPMSVNFVTLEFTVQSSF